MVTDRRSQKVWKRLIQNYGAARITEAYGMEPNELWIEAIEKLSDEQLAYGLRKVFRDSVIHPPTMGQFSQACADMPQPKTNSGPSIQEQLCAYAAKTFGSRLHPRQFSMPWQFEYKQWVDDSRPKHAQNCAECVAVVIPEFDEEHPGIRIAVDELPSYAPPFTYKPPAKAATTVPA